MRWNAPSDSIKTGSPLTLEDFRLPNYRGSEPADQPLSLDWVMANHVRKVLELAGGKVEGKGGAAEHLGVNPRTLRHRMRKLGVAFGRETKRVPALTVSAPSQRRAR
jgi:hypothetical protein